MAPQHTIERVTAVLTRELGPDTRFIPHITGAGALSGLVISDAFEDLDQVDRLRVLESIFGQHLAAADRANMLALLTLAPSETSDTEAHTALM